MIASETIRMSILQTALQGKLTEQLPTDGSVEDLLITISKKKQQMIDDGVIKKEKKLPPITQDNIFKIPSSWQWVRMQTFLDVRDGTHDSPKYVPSGIPFVTSKNISSGELDFSDVNYISKEDADKINQRSLVEENDILLAMIGSIGNPVKVHVDREFAIKNMALIKSVPDSNINMDYVLILLKYMQIKMKKDSSGGVQKFVSLSYLREFPVPLPPIEEQQRIVDRVNELLAKVDEFEKIENRLTAVKEKFPSDLRAAILQAAMQGKLTEQLDTDSSVDDLYNNLINERQSLIAKKALKNEKLQEIGDYPFDIPYGWRFIRLGCAINLLSGQDFTPDKYSDVKITDGVPYLTGASNIENGDVLINRWTTTPRAIAHKGDLLLTCKGTIGAMAFLPVESAHIARQIMAISVLEGMSIYYIKYCLDFYVSEIKSKAKSQIPGIDRKAILNLVIPLPPIEEQYRIVERLDALLPLCDEMTAG